MGDAGNAGRPRSSAAMTRGERSYGFVLVLVLASSVVQLVVSGSDGARLVVVALQAATLVAAVRTTEATREPARSARSWRSPS